VVGALGALSLYLGLVPGPLLRWIEPAVQAIALYGR